MSADVATQLAVDVAAAHRSVCELDITDVEKALASKRLLAISDAPKHDVGRAVKRLHTFMSDVDEGRISSCKRLDGG